MRYVYPMGEFPYAKLVAENARRPRTEREYELWDAYGPEKWAAGQYWDVSVEYAKAGPNEVLCRIAATNASSSTAELHILPHLTFRNTWSWGYDAARPYVEERDSSSHRTVCAAAHERHLGAMRWSVTVPESSGGRLTQPLELLLTDNVSRPCSQHGGRFVRPLELISPRDRLTCVRAASSAGDELRAPVQQRR